MTARRPRCEPDLDLLPPVPSPETASAPAESPATVSLAQQLRDFAIDAVFRCNPNVADVLYELAAILETGMPVQESPVAPVVLVQLDDLRRVVDAVRVLCAPRPDLAGAAGRLSDAVVEATR